MVIQTIPSLSLPGTGSSYEPTVELVNHILRKYTSIFITAILVFSSLTYDLKIADIQVS